MTACSPQATPSVVIPVTGDLHTHDPGLVVGDGDRPWFAFSTGDPHVAGGAIQVRTSPDGVDWAYAGEAWDDATKPAWVKEKVPGVTNYWAPEVVERDGTWYLYYAASTFGSNRSVIGLRTTPSLNPDDPGAGWTDQGEVVRSHAAKDYNAIDPAVLFDADDRAWLAFGSFWGGIQLVELDFPSGKPREGATPVTIAHRGTSPNAIEAPALLRRGDRYYLFVSFDSCCQGQDGTYNFILGRADAPEGPYLDADGVPLTEGGGTLLLATEGNRIGPGGQSVSGDHIAFHYYSAEKGGDFQLDIRRLGWTADGWPVVQGPDA